MRERTVRTRRAQAYLTARRARQASVAKEKRSPGGHIACACFVRRVVRHAGQGAAERSKAPRLVFREAANGVWAKRLSTSRITIS